MRKIFLLLGLLVCFSGFSQNPDYHRFGARSKYYQPDTLSTTLRDALTPKLGTILYHKDTGISQWEQWDGAEWKTFGEGIPRDSLIVQSPDSFGNIYHYWVGTEAQLDAEILSDPNFEDNKFIVCTDCPQTTYLTPTGNGSGLTGLTTSQITNLSSYTGFDSRYYTETETDNLLEDFVKIDDNTANVGYVLLNRSSSVNPPLFVNQTGTGAIARFYKGSSSGDFTGTGTFEIANNGNVSASGRVSGSDPVNDNDFVTKGYGFDNYRPYAVYVALLTQSGTSDPTATVLENTLGGTVVWTRTGTGAYNGTLSGAFIAGKTVTFISLAPVATNGDTVRAGRGSNNHVTVNTRQGDPNVSVDEGLTNTPIEIRVYP